MATLFVRADETAVIETHSRNRNGESISSEIAPPPFAPPLLERSKGAAGQIKRRHHAEPDGVDAGEVEPVARGLLRQEGAERPADVAHSDPGEAHGQRMDECDVHHVEEERHTPNVVMAPAIAPCVHSNSASRISAGPSVIIRYSSDGGYFSQSMNDSTVARTLACVLHVAGSP